MSLPHDMKRYTAENDGFVLFTPRQAAIGLLIVFAVAAIVERFL